MSGGLGELNNDDIDTESDSDNEMAGEEYLLSQVSTVTLRQIIKFLTIHDKTPLEDIPKPLPYTDLKKFVSPQSLAIWIEQFHRDEICELIMAANFWTYLPSSYCLCKPGVQHKK